MFELTRPAPTHLALTGNLTIYEVGEARTALVAAFADAREQAWQLDMAATQEIDSAGAQLLLAAQRHLNQAGGQLQLTAASPAVEEILGLLRLSLTAGDDHVR